MEFKEFCEIMKDVPYAENVAYTICVGGLHPDRLPYAITAITKMKWGKYRFPSKIEKHCVTNAFPRCFKNTLWIDHVILPKYLSVISQNAFEGSVNLQSMWIPETIYHIKRNAFKGCTALTDIYYEGTKQQWEVIRMDMYTDELASENCGGTFHEKRIYKGGYEELLKATIHFGCQYPKEG